MADNKLIKSRLWMVGLIVITAGISAGILTGINIYTKPMIAHNEEIKLKKSVLNAFSVSYDKKEIIDIFKKKIKVRDLDGAPYYEYHESSRLAGVAFKIKGPGFWGPISVLVALQPSLEIIKGIEILHQEETPGLGGRIAEDEFLDQFKGKSILPEISIDAITGATMTSKAFKTMMNENVKNNFS